MSLQAKKRATGTENQLPIYSSWPADLAAVTATAGGTFYMVGYSNGPGSSDVNLAAGSKPGATTLTLDATTNFYVGEAVSIDANVVANAEIAYVSAIASPVLTFSGGLVFGHADEAKVIGSACAFTPTYTGRARVTCKGDLTGNNTTDVMQAQIMLIDATANVPPAAGAGVVGTPIGNIANVTQLTGVLTQEFACEAMLGGPAATNTKPSGGAALTIGNPYFFDLQVTSTTSGKTVQAKNVMWAVQEV